MSTIWTAFKWGLGATLGFAVANLIIAIPAFLIIGGLIAASMSGAGS